MTVLSSPYARILRLITSTREKYSNATNNEHMANRPRVSVKRTSLPTWPTKRKVSCLTASDKQKLIRDIESGKSSADVSKDSGVPSYTVYRNVNKEKMKVEFECTDGNGKHKRPRFGKFPALERCLVEWIEDLRDDNIPVSGVLIKQKAHDLAEHLHIAYFTGSNDWLKGLSRQMKLGKRNIVLILDNCSAHTASPKLDHVKVIFLPPNTSKLQPMEQGIITNFKLLYRKEVVRLILSSIEQSSL
ncbi:hypothetical protein PR048_024945 [Dryococelus australis]|uniref:HTH CENPB-type domain-containing protein n=1 Tax=Dryococelus australis TaxID=614101 RepID=A0ABQ9GQ22_9NEOP|nr:hypothetical protein PR048_024945 [Dryococelus australis]